MLYRLLQYLSPILTHRIFFIFSGLLFWLFLELGYRFYVSEYFEYAGFPLNPNRLKYLEALLLYLVLLFWVPKLLSRPSDYFINFLLFGLMAPLFLFYALADETRRYLYIVLLGFFIIDFLRKGRVLRFPLVRQGNLVAIMLLVLGASTVTGWMFVSGGVSNFNLDLSKVYQFRRETAEMINVGIMGYVNIWAYKIFGPALLAIALWKKKYFLAVLVLCLQVFWFGVSTHKAVLFYPLLIIFLWIWYTRTKTLSLIPLAFTGVLGACLVILFAFDYGFFASLFVRRLFFVIANNTFDYYHFFDENQFVFWSNSITSAFVNYPYHIPPAELIGEVRGTDSHVNNTFLSTGFMHAGVLGIVFYAVVVGLLFRIIDSIC